MLTGLAWTPLQAQTQDIPQAHTQEFLPSWLLSKLLETGPTLRVFHGKGLTDRLGEHALVLTRDKTPSQLRPNPGRLERQVIRAVLYTRQGQHAEETWRIQDENDCPELDSESLFYTRHITFTDLNHDGILEVSVPYKMFCGGGIDPATLKIIMREDSRKYAIRGSTRIVMAGGSAGGDYTLDPTLLKPEHQDLKQHLLKLWQQISVERY